MTPEMKPWDFVIKQPEDLPVFADLLEEWDHPGHAVVRHLIAKKKFPGYSDRNEWSDPNWVPGWFWWVQHSGKKVPLKGVYELPEGALNGVYEVCYFTATEAIWAVVNAGKFLPNMK